MANRWTPAQQEALETRISCSQLLQEAARPQSSPNASRASQATWKAASISTSFSSSLSQRQPLLK